MTYPGGSSGYFTGSYTLNENNPALISAEVPIKRTIKGVKVRTGNRIYIRRTK
jgi:hypothetical protein